MTNMLSSLTSSAFRITTALSTIMACALLATCQTPPTPDAMARTTLQTAPADLQLLCANAVAGTAKLDSSAILPVSSSAMDPERFNVELNAAGKRYNCIVDTKGVVRSVQPM